MAISLLRSSLYASCKLKPSYFNSAKPFIKTSFHARLSSTLSQQFEEAKNRLNSLKSQPGNETKLEIYALFKQATVGKINIKQPGVLDMVGRAKWNSWNSLGTMSQDEARQNYIQLVNKLASAEGGTATTQAPTGEYATIKVTYDGAVQTILLNRPDKKNAINLQMYEDLCSALEEAAKNPKTVITVITGAGDYYCSGNDLSNFADMSSTGSSLSELSKKGGDILQKYVASYIDFPKLLIAMVNGPAVGISVTVLGLFDAVLASDKATFHTPFSALGQSAEGCSSFTFPMLMGFGKANEMLIFNKKLTATEALELGLVTEIYPSSSFQEKAWEKVKYIASLPPNSMLLSKKLIKGGLLPKLRDINKEECKLLVDRWQSEECLNAIMNFMQRKSKL